MYFNFNKNHQQYLNNYYIILINFISVNFNHHHKVHIYLFFLSINVDKFHFRLKLFFIICLQLINFNQKLLSKVNIFLFQIIHYIILIII